MKKGTAMVIGFDTLFRSCLTAISPKLNIFVVYAMKKHKLLNWKKPTTLAEKLLILRLKDYNSNPLVKQCADKYAVRRYVEEAGYGYLLNELIAVYDTPDEIKWELLPKRFALKLNFASSYNVICHDIDQFDKVYRFSTA
jgi:hypothetical protein